jgi:plastocyanin
MLRWTLIVFAVTLAVAPRGVAVAEEYGTLSGKFVLDGKAPTPAPLLNTNKDGCEKHNLLDESIVVGEDGGLAGVFVYLRTKDVPAAPSYKESEAAEVVLDNKNCRFEPHWLTVRAGQKLVVKNSDPFGHNSNLATMINPAANVLIAAGTSSTQEYKQEETLPTKVGCNIHPWMGALVLIRKSPYMTVSDKSGKFAIKDLPVGKELEFQLWFETCGFLKNVTFKGGKADTKGRFKLKLKPGDDDLGEIKVPLSALKK